MDILFIKDVNESIICFKIQTTIDNNIIIDVIVVQTIQMVVNLF